MTKTYPDVPGLIRTLLLAVSEVTTLAAGGIRGGECEQEEMNEGAIALNWNGVARWDLYVPLFNPRIQIDSYALTSKRASDISLAVLNYLDTVDHIVVTDPDSNLDFLVHTVYMVGGPLKYPENDRTRAVTIYYCVKVGTQVVS